MTELKFKAYNKKTEELCDVLLICFVNRYVDVLPARNLEGRNQESWSFDDILLLQDIDQKGIDGVKARIFKQYSLKTP